MRISPLVLVCVALAGSSVACSTEPDTSSSDRDDNEPSDKGGDDDDDHVDPDDPANQPPHALGTITLGEAHTADDSTAFPFVTATFVPDAAAASACKKKITDACELVATPTCAKECDEDEFCAFDKSCQPTCQKYAVCSMDCEDDEICTLDKKGKATCTKLETFDAGPIVFSGTTTAITLLPPYAYEADGDGAPFGPGAKLRVQAQGATEAGFEEFDETFTATSLIQPKPALKKLSRGALFGKDSVPIAWVPGKDAILISVAGSGGTVTCKAKDSDGSFDFPRSAVEAALGDDPSDYAPSLTVSVTRQRKETKKGLKTTGELSSATIQSEGWLDLVTSSTESVSLEGCESGLATCGDTCADLKINVSNCGACGNACNATSICSNGSCVASACRKCGEDVRKTTCKTEWNACKADPNCAAFFPCAAQCNTQDCVEQCVYNLPSTALDTYATCENNACGTACSGP